ncbi:hypothetical protein pb186bvf_003908 [Paramecium bursaria]
MQDLYIPLQDAAKRLNIKVSPIQSTRSSLAQLMPEFQVKSNAVQLKLQLIRNNNEEIAKNTETIHKAAETLKEKESMKKVEKIQQSTTLQTTEIKKLFAEIETLIKENDPNEPETRAMEYTKKALSQEVAVLLQQSQDVVHQYNVTLQNKMKRQVKYLRRQLDLLQPNLTDQQRNEIIRDPSGLEKIVCEQTLGKASLQVQYRVQDIQEKYKDIQKLEKSTQYCFQMLSEIALLVNQQGEQIDSIEQNLNKAQNYIQKAEKKLAKEKEVHEKSRKVLLKFTYCRKCVALQQLDQLPQGQLQHRLYQNLLRNDREQLL